MERGFGAGFTFLDVSRHGARVPRALRLMEKGTLFILGIALTFGRGAANKHRDAIESLASGV